MNRESYMSRIPSLAPARSDGLGLTTRLAFPGGTDHGLESKKAAKKRYET